MPRKPIAAVPYRETFVVICDDGSVWRFITSKKVWKRWSSIPGTASEAAERKKKSLLSDE